MTDTPMTDTERAELEEWIAANVDDSWEALERGTLELARELRRLSA